MGTKRCDVKLAKLEVDKHLLSMTKLSSVETRGKIDQAKVY